MKVTVEISTKNRYHTLYLTLWSILSQTYKPEHVLIFDDNDKPKDLLQDDVYKNIFNIFKNKNITFQIEKGARKGQVINHQKALSLVQTELIWRIDDDNIVEPNVLENLIKNIQTKDVGAVGCSILHTNDEYPIEILSSDIKDVLFKYAIQFSRFKGIKETQFLYSSFLFKKEVN